MYAAIQVDRGKVIKNLRSGLGDAVLRTMYGVNENTALAYVVQREWFADTSSFQTDAEKSQLEPATSG